MKNMNWRRIWTKFLLIQLFDISRIKVEKVKALTHRVFNVYGNKYSNFISHFHCMKQQRNICFFTFHSKLTIYKIFEKNYIIAIKWSYKIISLWDIVSQCMFNITYSKPVNTTHAKNEGLFNECWCCDDIILNITKVLHMNGYLSSLNLCNMRTCIRHFILINILIHEKLLHSISINDISVV